MLKFPDTGENILANAARLFFPPLEEQFSHNAYITLTTLFYIEVTSMAYSCKNLYRN